MSLATSNARWIVAVGLVPSRAMQTTGLARRAHFTRTASCACFVNRHEVTHLTFETKGGTWIRRFFLAHTRFACGLFGLVGVIVFRAFRAVRLPLF